MKISNEGGGPAQSGIGGATAHGPAAPRYGAAALNQFPADWSLRLWRTGLGDRHSYGLFRRPGSAGLWAFLRLRWWFGLEVRWDPKIIGSKVMVTLFDHDFGWLS